LRGNRLGETYDDAAIVQTPNTTTTTNNDVVNIVVVVTIEFCGFFGKRRATAPNVPSEGRRPDGLSA
jgi:hypothetical protein